MTLVLAWIVLPVVLGGLALGCGLLLELVVGDQLPGELLLPAGFAVVITAASLTTISAATAGLTSPLVVALAVAGLGLAFPLGRRPNPWSLACVLAVFVVYAAPIVLSGSATVAGYISLDDTATWLAIADNALTHGRSLAGLAPSTYSAVLHDDLAGGYPIGSMVPLGIGHQLTGQDAAWLFQPYIAFLGGLLALSIYALVAPLVRRRRLCAAVAFVGAQPALLYGYAFWSGIKEVTVAYLIALVSALALYGLTGVWRARRAIPLAVAASALLVCVSVLGVVWLAGVVLFALLLDARYGLRRTTFSLAPILVFGIVLVLPALASARRFVQGADRSDAGNGALGNLFHPLSNLQLLGIWPSGDFRGRPAHMGVTGILLALVALAAAFGLVEAARRRAWGLVLYAVASVVGWGLVVALDSLGHGSPWLDGKALASASPALLVSGMAGAALLLRRGSRVAGVIAMVAIGSGVLWSNALAYGYVWLAPRDQLAELQAIGRRFAGDGPTLMTEYQPYGVRHFLRNMDAEGASERRTRPVGLRSGGVLDKGQYADLDAFDLGAVDAYRTLVLRVSPLESRPPSSYVPVWVGHWYEVWQRLPGAAPVVTHLSLGTDGDPNGVPVCRKVRRLGALAASRGLMLVASVRPQPRVFKLAAWQRPSSWSAGPGGTLLPVGSGIVNQTIDLLRGGRVGFWVGGSFRGRLQLYVDGAQIGSARDQLEETAQLTPLGDPVLTEGSHRVGLSYGGPGWRPGSRGTPFLLGPLVIGEPATAARLVRVGPAKATSLCGRTLDWVETAAAG
jgi:hypothetical protein